MKQGLLIKATGGQNWIGGLYYAKNMAYQLSLNKEICQRYDIYVFVERENAGLFKSLPRKIKIVVFGSKNRYVQKLMFLIFIKRYKIHYVFPVDTNLSKLGVRSICWIPDFQHKHYPGFFDAEEIDRREKRFRKLCDSDMPIILSSNSCYDDLKKFYKDNGKVFVVPFVSYIVDVLAKLNLNAEKEILEKYKLINKNYIVIMNQFWEHKNHIIVLKALIEYYQKNNDSDVEVVLTGKIREDSHSEYLDNLNKLLENKVLVHKIHLLGFIDRTDQIVIMKNSMYVIQPSLFEGWGTVLEDAKVLDKTVLLSDIPVHREQMNDKCVLFDPNDATGLADMIETENSKKHISDLREGVKDMRSRAVAYSKGFQKMLDSCK